MFIKQVSVFIENKPGSLKNVLDILGKNGIDINALSIADKTDFGILRMIVSDEEKAVSVLKESGFIVKSRDVIGITIEDKPGALTAVLALLEEKGISVEYVYAFMGNGEKGAAVVMRVDRQEETVEALSRAGIGILSIRDIEAK